MVPIPSQEDQAHITTLLTTLITRLESHPKFTPPTPNPALLHTWDFVQRTRYIMINLDNIRHARPVEHPEQIPANPEAKDDEERARMSFADVLTRSITTNKIMGDTVMLRMMGGEGLDFGEECKDAGKAVVDGIMGLKDDTPDPTTAQAQA